MKEDGLGGRGWGSGLGRKNLRLPSRSDDVSARSVGHSRAKISPQRSCAVARSGQASALAGGRREEHSLCSKAGAHLKAPCLESVTSLHSWQLNSKFFLEGRSQHHSSTAASERKGGRFLLSTHQVRRFLHFIFLRPPTSPGRSVLFPHPQLMKWRPSKLFTLRLPCRWLAELRFEPASVWLECSRFSVVWQRPLASAAVIHREGLGLCSCSGCSLPSKHILCLGWCVCTVGPLYLRVLHPVESIQGQSFQKVPKKQNLNLPCTPATLYIAFTLYLQLFT